MTVVYIILWIVGLAVVPWVAAYIGEATTRGPGDEGVARIIGIMVITFVIYVIVSAILFFYL